MDCRGGRAPDGCGPFTGYQVQPNSECRDTMHGSQAAADKGRGREGNSPDRQLRSPSRAKWERKSDCTDSQEVGSEAATPSKSA